MNMIDLSSVLVDKTKSRILDGNAMAGLLHELLDVEMTAAMVVCGNCKHHGEMGSLWAFMESPGYVLRCPDCQNIVMRLNVTPNQVYLDARGAAYLCVPQKG